MLRGIGGREHHWLGIELLGKDHACVVGARAVLDVGELRLTRFAKGGGSYASAGDRRMVFGLGKGAPGRVTVNWPDGTAQSFDNLAADRYYRIVQGNDKPQPGPAAK